MHNINIALEAFHKIFKYVYLKGKIPTSWHTSVEFAKNCEGQPNHTILSYDSN